MEAQCQRPEIDPWQRAKLRCRAALEDTRVEFCLMLCTLWALFAPDVKVASGVPRSADSGLGVVTCVVLTVFVVEIAGSVWAKDGTSGDGAARKSRFTRCERNHSAGADVLERASRVVAPSTSPTDSLPAGKSRSNQPRAGGRTISFQEDTPLAVAPKAAKRSQAFTSKATRTNHGTCHV